LQTFHYDDNDDYSVREQQRYVGP